MVLLLGRVRIKSQVWYVNKQILTLYVYNNTDFYVKIP